MVTTFPALETAIIHVRNVARVECGDKIRTTIDGESIGYPPVLFQVSTFSDWKAALCQRAKDADRPLSISWRNYGSGDRRLVFVDWAV